MELHETTFTDILNMFGQRKSESNHTPKFFTDSAGQRGLPKLVVGKYAFNLSLCLFEPNTINSVNKLTRVLVGEFGLSGDSKNQCKIVAGL